MALLDFDYGAELEASGFKKELPVEGLHLARLQSIIHLGKCVHVYQGEAKAPCNTAVAIFELKEETDIHSETGEPLTFSVEFTLKDGAKSFLHKTLIPSLVTKADQAAGTVKSFDDLIGRVCQLDLKPSKGLNEDGSPKYMNLSAMSAAHAKMIAVTDELKNVGSGHLRLKDFNKEALESLNSYIHVQQLIMKSVEWDDGSHPAIPLVEEIRKTNPDYAKAKPKEAESAEGEAEQSKAPAGPVEEVKADEEF